MTTDLPTGLIFAAAPPAPSTFNLLLFGPPGSGKSTAVAGLATRGPILWVNAEGPAAILYARKLVGSDRILEVRIDPTTPGDVRETLRQVVRHIKDHTEPAPATVVIDTLGKLRDALVKQLVQPGSKNSLQQYGDVARTLGDCIKTLRDLPVNLVLLAHEHVEDNDGERIVRPLIGGALTETVPGDMDVVAYTSRVHEDKVEKFYGQFTEAKGRRCKDRSGVLGPFREIDLETWLALYCQALVSDNSDIPWEPDPDAPEESHEDGQQTLDEAAA